MRVGARCGAGDGGSTETSAGGAGTNTAGSSPAGAAPTTTLPPAPASPEPPLLDEAKVEHAVDALDGIVAHIMDETGVPGIAIAVGDEQATWTDPVKTWNPDFELGHPYVTDHATLQDLLSHRSGLPNGGGDLLEDLGWDRDYILSKVDQLPLHPFRAVYDYSNFGVTEAGVAAADAAGLSWEDLADSVLFDRIGMDSSSYATPTTKRGTTRR
jgi:CubicO group peptidase (beta-lactamase class C family)